MTSENTEQPRDKRPEGSKKPVPAPGWANGRRQLYDSVVEEPLPDSFKDLLAQFDDDEDGENLDRKSDNASGAEDRA